MQDTRTYLNILVQLARVDGVVVQEEIDLINQIGRANDMSEEEINRCFDEPSDVGSLSHLSADEKFEYIYGIVQLMKIDGRLYQDEIQFCAKMAAKLSVVVKMHPFEPSADGAPIFSNQSSQFSEVLKKRRFEFFGLLCGCARRVANSD